MSVRKPALKNIYAEFAALPPNMVGEIVSGTLYAHPRPARPHGRAASELGAELIAQFRRGRGGPGGWVFLDEHELHLGEHIVVPDISGWRNERYPSHETTPYSIVAPDWLCEVTSPSTRRLDRIQKLPIYAAHGVKHCWYVDPLERTLEVFILSGTTYTIGPTFADNAPVTAPPFEAHTFELGVLWEEGDALTQVNPPA
jgi:Uma2 family endonuclease